MLANNQGNSTKITELKQKLKLITQELTYTTTHASNCTFIGGGYLTIQEHPILGRHNNHQEKQALDAINIMQNIEWELCPIAVKYVEKPKHDLDTQEKKVAWQQHIDMSTTVYQEMMDAGNSFWLSCRFDFRGRMYTQGHYINLQSTGYKKSLLNFKHRELIK